MNGAAAARAPRVALLAGLALAAFSPAAIAQTVDTSSRSAALNAPVATSNAIRDAALDAPVATRSAASNGPVATGSATLHGATGNAELSEPVATGSATLHGATGNAELSEPVATSTATRNAAWDALTTGVRAEDEPGLELPALVLRLPQDFVELAFTPLLPVALAFERWRLHQRLIDLLLNDERTLAVLPVIVPFNSSGLGLGAAVIYNEPLGSADRLVLYGLGKLNGDLDVSASFSQRFARLSGRAVSVGASWSVDHDMRYYGLGANSDRSAERSLRQDAVNAELGLVFLTDQTDPEYSADIRIAYRLRRLTTGDDNRSPGFVPGESLDSPPGFGRTLDYPEVKLRGIYDSRDSVGRTQRGLVASFEVEATHDTNDSATGGVKLTASVAGFIPLLPLYRVLFLRFAAAAAVPLGEAEEVPMFQLVNLGGSNILRGYVSDRFIDRLGWWATAEYRYRFYDYADEGMGLTAALFLDAGHVGRQPGDLVKGPLPWSVGMNLRLEQDLLLVGRIQVAYSPEGFRFSVGFGEVLD